MVLGDVENRDLHVAAQEFDLQRDDGFGDPDHGEDAAED